MCREIWGSYISLIDLQIQWLEDINDENEEQSGIQNETNSF